MQGTKQSRRLFIKSKKGHNRIQKRDYIVIQSQWSFLFSRQESECPFLEFLSSQNLTKIFVLIQKYFSLLAMLRDFLTEHLKCH